MKNKLENFRFLGEHCPRFIQDLMDGVPVIHTHLDWKNFTRLYKM